MRTFFAFRRLFRIATRYRLEQALPRKRFLVRFLMILCHPIEAFRSRHHHFEPTHLSDIFEAMGPLFIKLGQVLSMRQDIIPEKWASALVLLQERVTPFDGEQAKRITEEALGEALTSFDTQCLASGSVAQVHDVLLKDGRSVVVKLLRPGIKIEAHKNCQLLRQLAKGLSIFLPEIKKFKPLEMISEIEFSLNEELDLVKEASNASLLKRQFEGSGLVRVPEVIWPYCSSEVMVMEKMTHCCSVADLTQIRAQGIDLKRLAEKSVILFYTQVFREGFFHADMHPGNVYVDLTKTKDPEFVAFDFGITGTLSRQDQYYLACNFLAFFNRDYRRVAELHIDSGWVHPKTRVERLEAAVRHVCEPIFERPLGDISFGQTLLTLFQTARSFEMNIQPQLLLLQKTLVNIEGIARMLHPELDLWETAKPFLEKWMREQIGVKGLWKRIKRQGPFLSEYLPELPRLIIAQLATAAVVQQDPPKK